MFTDFYHGLIRKTTIAFGTLFNNIYINREDGNRIKVPLIYSAKEKFIHRINKSLSDLNNQALQIILPRMSFSITNFQYDPERKKNTMQKRYKETVDVDGDISYSYHYSNVPYNIDYSLTCYARNMDDGLQIVEQILPYFTPEFTVTIKPGILSDSNEKLDIPIILNTVTNEELYEGAFSEENTRMLTWTLGFTAKMMVYGPVKNQGLIKSVETNIFDLEL
jgi:hypothetical protein